MADIDLYAVALFEQAKSFLDRAKTAGSPEAKQAFLNAALLLGTSSLEAHINAIAEELLIRPALSMLERSALGEQDYVFAKGEFSLTTRLKMYRLEERLQLIFKRFTKISNPTAEPWWSGLGSAIDLRNRVVHAKAPATLTQSVVERALQAILDCVNALYKGLFKKTYPGYGRGLDSTIDLSAASA